MNGNGWRLPAEWERQQATVLAWPHAGTDWHDQLEAIQNEYTELIDTLARFQPVLLLLAPGEDPPSLPDSGRVTLIRTPYNDTWCRDYGPIGLLRGPDRCWMDFRFNGWGGKYAANDDDRVTASLLGHPAFRNDSHRRSELELEGGATDTDGAGRLLVNWYCLRTRLPGMSRESIANVLQTELGVEHVAGIDIPALPGDDTDGHIDTLARFAAPGSVVYQASGDRESDDRLAEQLHAALHPTGLDPVLHALPATAGIEAGLPASYANFIFANGALLVPAYGLAADETARALLAAIHPDREVISVSARTMIRQFGALHCATMQLPAAPS